MASMFVVVLSSLMAWNGSVPACAPHTHVTVVVSVVSAVSERQYVSVIGGIKCRCNHLRRDCASVVVNDCVSGYGGSPLIFWNLSCHFVNCRMDSCRLRDNATPCILAYNVIYPVAQRLGSAGECCWRCR